jgi:hypothetical protein
MNLEDPYNQSMPPNGTRKTRSMLVITLVISVCLLIVVCLIAPSSVQ